MLRGSRGNLWPRNVPPKSSRSAGSMAFAILRSQQSTRKEAAPRSADSSVDLRGVIVASTAPEISESVFKMKGALAFRQVCTRARPPSLLGLEQVHDRQVDDAALAVENSAGQYKVSRVRARGSAVRKAREQGRTCSAP